MICKLSSAVLYFLCINSNDIVREKNAVNVHFSGPR